MLYAIAVGQIITVKYSTDIALLPI